MATCLDVGGAAYPKEFKGKKLVPLQGVSLRPAFEGKPIHRSEPIFWEHEGNRAVLEGDWKLVALSGQPWRLYNILADRSEQHDLASAEPKRVKVLAAKWDAYAARANVLPLGGWQGAKPRRARAANLSTKTKFVLKAGDHLERDQAPAVVRRGFTIKARFDASDPNGVILAQGGASHGYTLYLKDGRLVFLVRVAGKAVSLATTQTLTGAHEAAARLDASGAMSLTVDGAAVPGDRTAGLLTTMPTDGLDVGTDQGGLVGEYPAENRFHGAISSLVIELDPK